MAGTGPFCCRASCQRKLHPGMSAQTGTHFPDWPSSGSYVPDSGSRVGCRFRLRFLAEAVSRNRASEWDVLFRQELKWKLCPRIDMASSGKRVSEYRAGVFGGRGWKGEHRLHARRRRGSDSHGGSWGVVVLRACGRAVLPLPKIHLLNPTSVGKIKLTAAQVEKSWAAPLLSSRGQCLNGVDPSFYVSNTA